MAGKVQHRSLYEIPDLISQKNFLPIYFFCGEDTFAIDGVVKKLIEAIEPEIVSDFDKETITADKKIQAQQILDLALAFPFGGNKKLLIIKEFGNIEGKDIFADYVNNPPDFTYLICVQPGKMNAVRNEPYKSLHKNKFIFEARKLKDDELVDWLLKYAKAKKMKLTYENASTMVEIVGDEKSLLEQTIQKLYDNVGEGGEITLELIANLASSTRIYTTFDLQDEIGRGNKAKALEIAYNLLDSGMEMGQIISMLTKFCTMNAQSIELSKKFKNNTFEAAKEAGWNPYYYKNSTVNNIYNDKERLINAAKALYKADFSVKTSAADHKTILTVLISEMISN